MYSDRKGLRIFEMNLMLKLLNQFILEHYTIYLEQSQSSSRVITKYHKCFIRDLCLSNVVTRLAVGKVKPCTGYGVGVVMQNKPSWCYNFGLVHKEVFH